MKCFRSLLLSLLLIFQLPASAQTLSAADMKADFEELWTTVRDNYAYLDDRQLEWACVHGVYERSLDSVHNRYQFVLFLEQLLRELYDHHIGLNTNTAHSFRLVPTGADLWARMQKGKAIITNVRPGTGAGRCGIRAGMEVIAINGKPIREALQSIKPLCQMAEDSASDNYRLQVLLAGTHDTPRELRLRVNGSVQNFLPDAEANMDKHGNGDLVQTRYLDGNIGYIRVGNRLGDDELIDAFDRALDGMLATNALILDLRETPSGGNSNVARAIMGRFIEKEGPYQKHELVSEERAGGPKRSWLEIVSPRGRTYTGKLIVLVGPWTGSMGEGIAIGFDGLRRGQLVGDRMAGLCGAIYSYKLPHSGISFSLPAERIYHVDGTPRERFARIRIVAEEKDKDAVLDAAHRMLIRK